MRSKRQFINLGHEKCQVRWTIVPWVARLPLPRLRIERLGQSLRGTAVNAAFGPECGRLDPGEQCGTTRWLPGDDLHMLV